MATTLKSIDKRIATFTTNRDKLRNDAHEIAMLIVNHAAPTACGPNAQGTGDCTRMLRLMQAMPSSWAEQMDFWLRKFTPIRVIVKNGKCEYSKEYKALSSAEEKVEAWDLEGAAATPYYEAKKEEAPKPALDFEALCKMVEGLGKRIAKKVEDGEVKPEDMESAKAIAAKVSAIKLVRVKPANTNTAVEGEQAVA
jgi:hypothetical protein